MSCQVKETNSTGLIADHNEVANKFTIDEPNSDILRQSDVASIYLSFPFPVSVNTASGTPTLTLEIGSSTVAANYVSGNNTKKLLFQYTIGASEQDNDGIKVTALNKNGATLKFNSNDTITDCSTTITAKVLSSLTVDNTSPQIQNFKQVNPPGFYHYDDTLTFLVTFSEVVKVTGTPRFQLGLSTGGNVYANYAAGSGSKTISFTYKITSADADIDGYNFTSPIELNAGTIKDNAGNSASLDFSSFVSSLESETMLVQFDGQVPYSTSIVIPTPGVYLSAQNLNFSVYFNRSVTVTGSPYIVLTIGSHSREAHYFSGSGSNQLTFRYTTVPGDVDLDGIVVGSSIVQNSGDIVGTLSPTQSFFVHNDNNVLTIPNTIGILVSATLPEPISVTKNNDTTSPLWDSSPDNVWIIGQQILLTVGFNTGIYVNQTGGTPRIPITIGSSSKYANYLSGGNGQNSIVFAYTIEEGDTDLDGTITFGNIELNGGTIMDAYSTNSTLILPSSSFSGITVDGIRPYIASVTAPPNGYYSESNIDNFDFTVNWSEPVHYSDSTSSGTKITLNIGGSSTNAIYESGNNTSTIIHAPSTVAGLSDLDGISMNSLLGGTGTVKDQAGNTATDVSFTAPNTSNIFVDSNSPYIASITPPLAGIYTTGQTLDFVVEFSESVTVDVSSGNPYLLIAVGNNTRLASVTSGGTSLTHTFRYTVAADDSDPDFVDFHSFSITIPGSSYIRDDSSNNLLSTTFPNPAWTGVIVDEVGPTISNATTTAGTYVATGEGDDQITINLTFSEEIILDTNNGSPTIALSFGTGVVSAIYDPINSTNTSLIFNYTIDGSQDLDLDGVTLDDTNLQLNGATIVDGYNNSANLNIGTITNLSSVYVAPHASVWIKGSTTNRSGFTSKPTITTNATLSGGYFIMNGTTHTLSLSSLNNIYAAYLAIKSPSSSDAFPQDLFDSGTFSFDNSSLDISTIDSPDFKTSSSYNGSGNNHTGAMTANSYVQLELLYSSGTSLPISPLIPSNFSGDIAEIILFDSGLSSGQKSHAYNYIDNSYP